MGWTDDGTACIDCALAVKDKSGRVQSGCLAGRNSIYAELGATVEEVYNGEDEFFLIRDKFCNYFRPEGTWGAAHTKENRLKDVQKETVRKLVDYIVYVDGDQDINRIVQDIAHQTLRPSGTTHLVLNHSVFPPAKYIDILRGGNLRWSVSVVTWDLSEDLALNLAADKCESCYYVVLYPSGRLSKYFTDNLDYRVNTELKLFSLAWPQLLKKNDFPNSLNYHTLVVNSAAHKSVGGNSTLSVSEKIVERAKEQGNYDKVVINYEDLFA